MDQEDNVPVERSIRDD